MGVGDHLPQYKFTSRQPDKQDLMVYHKALLTHTPVSTLTYITALTGEELETAF